MLAFDQMHLIKCQIKFARVNGALGDNMSTRSGAERRLSFSGGARQLFADKRTWLARC